MNYNQSNEPYYDDYDDSKNYVQVLMRPEQAVQARELNQIQSIGLDYLSRLGNSVYKSGAIINGCVLSIDGTIATISEGDLFVGGLVRHIRESKVEISGVGTEYIGAVVREDIITSEDDPTLRDPAVGYENYGQEGAHRLRQYIEFVVNEDGASTVYTLQDGVVVNESENNDKYEITETLARRTFDESGNFKVNGLDITESDTDKLGIVISSGKAYIKGYEVTKNAMTNISLKASDDVETINNEPKLYTIPSELHALNYGPVYKILSVVAQVRVNEERVTRVAPLGGLDALQHTPVVSIDTVVANSEGSSVIYQKERDYTLSVDSVDWSLHMDGSIEPPIGSSYLVTYVYNKQLEEGVDYILTKDVDGNNCIKFLETGNLPIPGTRVSISYQIYLSRVDLILLDSKGEFSIIQGKSDRASKVITPYNMDESKLELGKVLVSANSEGLTITNYKTTRLTQSDIYDLSKRIDDLEYNQAIQDLDNEAESGEAATELKGIFTDGFIGISKCDLSHPDFNCRIDYDMQELTLPEGYMGNSLKINRSESTIGSVGRVISAPFIHDLVMTQPYATADMLVNPYAAYNPLAKVTLNPSVDNWIDTNTVKIYDTVNNTVVNTKRQTLSSYQVFGTHRWHSLQRSSSTTQNLGNTYSTSTAVTKSVSDSMIEYMRSREIEITGDSFDSDEDNIVCSFNDIPVVMTPTGSTLAGAESGSIRADSNGSFTAKVTIPAGVPCGSASVKLQGSVSSGEAIYTANGTLRTTTVTTTTTNTTTQNVLITTHNVYESDPLAQSFVFPEDTVLTRVGLYFAAKDSVRAAVVQVRNIVNGYPGSEIYSEVSLRSDKVNVSKDSSAVTLVDFEQPVYCKANTYYCFVVLSDCNSYKMFYAELGGTDLITGKYIASQPYAAGVMFSSSNSSTWTAHQASDLKFDLYRSKYTGKGSIIFDEVTAAEFNRLMLVADYVDYKNSGIDWFFRYFQDSTQTWSGWQNIDSYVERSPDQLAKKIQLKAELEVGYQTSPMIAEDCINLITMTDGAKGTYISRSVFFSDSYTKLKVACQLYLPSRDTPCGYNLYYSTDNGTNWNKIEVTPSVSKVTEEFYEYVWEVDPIVGGSATSYKVKLELWTNNVFYRPRARKLRSILKY